jgi:hypothetical protein
MLRAGQHGWASPSTLVTTALLVASIACSSPGDTQAGAPQAGSRGDPATTSVAPVAVPEIGFAGMRSTASTLDAATVAEEAVDPDGFASMLASDGFVAAGQRLYRGTSGQLVRIALRRWAFSDEAGAQAFLASLRHEPQQLIGAAKPVDTARLPSSVTMVKHRASACCHEETAIYLASWQRGDSVWTVQASGVAITSDKATAFTMLAELKTRDG